MMEARVPARIDRQPISPPTPNAPWCCESQLGQDWERVE